ncbi:hypothetical protein THAOC_06467 [Thalassiosira oceanica]|uniref:Uncharacterized protein n=1 Tax=Thalassiosira oceanica TaxID=159749 RepID=K0TEU3_THAOC|nr:hypothetical protein THAOC_06467 [Thalassiosira oceanica]|eukprot:EJK72041.1 hypothetical protein THAOC_06467 [Thalassiosira oceanica]
MYAKYHFSWKDSTSRGNKALEDCSGFEIRFRYPFPTLCPKGDEGTSRGEKNSGPVSSVDGGPRRRRSARTPLWGEEYSNRRPRDHKRRRLVRVGAHHTDVAVYAAAADAAGASSRATSSHVYKVSAARKPYWSTRGRLH